MLVSCLCPTYNRAPNHLHLLAEAIESFLRQKLPSGVHAELIILNDTPGQMLRCPGEGIFVRLCDNQRYIRIYNVGERSGPVEVHGRYGTLGEKRNELCRMAVGDLFLPWDDDDISLPGRIAQAVENFRAGIGYFNPQRSWWLDSGSLHSDHRHGYCHNASAFSREAWRQVGGYPATSGNEDAIMDGRLRRAFGVSPPVEDRRQWQYIYRWGVSPRHLSGHADGPADDPHGKHYKRIGEQSIMTGKFVVSPAWSLDYQAFCDAHCARTVA